MNKNKILMFALLPLVLSTVVGCNGDKGNSNPTSGKGSASTIDSTSYSFSQELDTTNLIPQDVLNANVEITLAVYVEGQNGIIKDIGNYSPDPDDKSRKYHPADITSIEFAEYVGAAWEFKKIAPNVKINLMYTSIASYPAMIKDFYEQNGYYPELLRSTQSVSQNLENGISYDLSRYSATEYYNQYNEYFLSRFNFGGFQAAFPIAAHPWGILVNLDALEKYNIVLDTMDETTGEATQEYKDWVDNFTWDSLVDAARKSNTDTHAAFSKMVENFTSYSVASINDQYISTGTVDLTSPEVAQTISRLLNYENELSQYCLYEYNEDFTGTKNKPQFENARSWLGVENFVKDEYSTFYAEAPWSVSTCSTYVDANNEKVGVVDGYSYLSPRIDYIPYPKVDENATQYGGEAIGGVTVADQCPVGSVCTADKQLRMDVAAYFTMFMTLDPRSVKGRSNIEYIFNDRHYVGSLEYPLCKRGHKFDFQNNEEEDPASDYDDNWQYHMANWFKNYKIYVTNDEEADVRNFSNITYGLVKMLDNVYMIDGIGDDTVACINYTNEPVLIPDLDNDGGVINIFEQWTNRFTNFAGENGSGKLGTDTYVDTIVAQLNNIETKINTNSAMAWAFLQESMDTYYVGDYNVLDKSYRNSYEGNKFGN